MPFKSKPTIGIITVPLSPDRPHAKRCGDSYVSSSYIDWLKKAGLEVLPIPYTTIDHQYYFDRINGLYFPGGSVFASNDEAYYRCCKKFFELAVQANNRGDYFPIWAVCLGMQQMMIIAEGNDNMKLLEEFDSYNHLKLPLHFTIDGLKSRLMTYLLEENPKMLAVMHDYPITINNHMMGLSPAKYNTLPKLKSFFRIVSYNYCRQGKQFISTIEAYDYPFYGFQWHPESDPAMYNMGRFLENETRKNKHTTKKISKKLEMQHLEVNCSRSTGIYRVCHFYWHTKVPQSTIKACHL